MQYKALVAKEISGTTQVQLETLTLKDLGPGEVVIKTEYSSVNYKDALGITGKGKIYKFNPIVGGIDVAGTIIETRSSNFKKGDLVLVTGCGLGETHDGGYAELVIENEKNVIAIPRGLSLREAMILGTAGFTAGLCLERMEMNGQKVEMGPILVTGASGGVGQFAISIFRTHGYEVEALTSKAGLEKRLLSIGAHKVHESKYYTFAKKPLETVSLGGVIDNVGGSVLTGLIPYIQLWGNVASVGLALSHEINMTVMPFILRGISLLGISSNNTPWNLRKKIWERLASDLKPPQLESFVSEEVTFENILQSSERLIANRNQGRILVRPQQ